MTRDFDATFAALREIAAEYAPFCVVRADEPGNFSLDTPATGPAGRPLFFAAVQVKARYVSFHLFPVYTDPDLLEGVSEGLRKRMQGKSCFNFTQPDPELLEELRELVQAGAARYREQGHLRG